jgi:hypothetical protein
MIFSSTRESNSEEVQKNPAPKEEIQTKPQGASKANPFLDE